MNSSTKLLLAGAILVLGMGAASSQAATLDVVRDSNGTPVRTKDNDCVRSNWLSDSNSCKDQEASAPAVITASKPVYFAFGRSSLTTDGKKALNAIAADIKAKGPAVTSVRVAGFADRIGSAAANEKLSKKRADTVRKYLVSKGIVNAQVVETRWFGESQPATDCPKNLSRAKLIKCLQPDRRVEVEVDTIAPEAE
ncbi:MAG: OmpA family protein [Alphaproteobacteria bacterium]|nr:OmpA family protein [Alphaproteobacteria bacterium]